MEPATSTSPPGHLRASRASFTPAWFTASKRSSSLCAASLTRGWRRRCSSGLMISAGADERDVQRHHPARGRSGSPPRRSADAERRSRRACPCLRRRRAAARCRGVPRSGSSRHSSTAPSRSPRSSGAVNTARGTGQARSGDAVRRRIEHSPARPRGRRCGGRPPRARGRRASSSTEELAGDGVSGGLAATPLRSLTMSFPDMPGVRHGV